MPNPTGPDLRRQRRAAEITVTAVASEMGISRQAVHGIERAAAPDQERVAQYRAALARLAGGRLAS